MIKFDKYFFFNTESWFKTCFTFLMLITYSVLSCKLATSFSIFQFSLFQLKMLDDCEVYVNFLGIEYQPQKKKKKKSFLHYKFFKAFIKFRIILNKIKVIDKQLLRHYWIMQIIYIPIFRIWKFIFTTSFHVFVISFYISMDSVTYSSPYRFFYH